MGSENEESKAVGERGALTRIDEQAAFAGIHAFCIDA